MRVREFCPLFSRTLVGKSVRTSERTFQELKSQNALDAFRTTSANIVETLIRSALLTLVASRRLYNPVRARAPPERVPPNTRTSWSMEFREGGSALLACRLARPGHEEFSEKVWPDDLGYRLTVCALAPRFRRAPAREQ